MIDKILKETEAILTGHFLLSSGKHSDKYVQCAKLMQYPDKAETVIKEITSQLNDIQFETVCGPAMGGIIVAYELARQTGKKAVFTERENGEMKLRRGFEIKPGEKIIIAEDVITTGKSTYETIKVLEKLGAEIVAITCIADRSKGNLKHTVYSAVQPDIETWEKEECPLCKKGSTPVKPGSRKIEQ